MSSKRGVVRGSGNVYRNLGMPDPDVRQLKAILAAEIIKVLDKERLSVRAAQARTGIAAADFSRIRNADLARFTVDRLVKIINRLGSRVEVKVRIRPRRTASARVPPLKRHRLATQVHDSRADVRRAAASSSGPGRRATLDRCGDAPRGVRR